MRKITLFRTLSIIIVVFNILNFFFMAASYTGINVKESATISDYAFYNYSNIDGMYHVIGSASDNRLIPAIVILFVDIYLLFVLLFRTTKASDYLSMPYKRIFITCAIGIFLHIFCEGQPTQIARLVVQCVAVDVVHCSGFIGVWIGAKRLRHQSAD